MEMPDVMLILGVLSTLMTIIMTSSYLKFRTRENRKDRENKLKMKKLTITAKKVEKSGKLGGILKNIDIEGLLEDVEDEEDIDELPIPGWLKPLAKGFLTKFLEKKSGGGDEEEGVAFEK
jgi:hypothetical protein